MIKRKSYLGWVGHGRMKKKGDELRCTIQVREMEKNRARARDVEIW